MKNIFLSFLMLMLFAFTSCAQTSTSSNQEVKNLNATEVKNTLASKNDIVILDVRTPEEYNNGHLKGATNINFYDDNFEKQIAQLDSNKTYLIYCASGNRSGKTGKLMLEKNFGNVYNATAGFNELKSAGLPTE